MRKFLASLFQFIRAGFLVYTGLRKFGLEA